MTSPPTSILVLCPGCGSKYATFYRPSINTGLGEEWSEDEIDAATTATCPKCGQNVALDALVVRGEVWELH